MEDKDTDGDNNKAKNDDKGISALGLDRDLGFSEDVKDIKGIYLDDADDNNNEDNEEDKNKDEDNNKDNNDDKGISALGLDKDLEFSRGQQGHQGHRPPW